MSMNWLPEALPDRVETGRLVFVPLTPELVVPDYAAVMRDVEVLRAWSGEDWPTTDFPIELNLADLVCHDQEQREGIALTYSILIDSVVQGCCYVWPLIHSLGGRSIEVPADAVLPADDVVVRGWLHDASAIELVRSVTEWLTAAPFAFPRLWWQTNTQCPEQVAACDELGLTDELAFAGVDRRWLLRSRPH
jgi:hypothetical protein